MTARNQELTTKMSVQDNKESASTSRSLDLSMNSAHEIRRSPTTASSAHSISDVNIFGRRLREHDQRRTEISSSKLTLHPSLRKRTPSNSIDYHPELKCFNNPVNLECDESDQLLGFEYLEDGLRAEASYLEDAVERVFILDLDLLDQSFKNSKNQFDDACYGSIAKDSLEVMRRRKARNGKSQMKVLNDFRKTFSNPAMCTNDHQSSINAISPPTL